MNDMRATIIPKSDQINADDLIAGPRTITVTGVSIRPGTEQPVSVNYEDDNGKPYKPCKSMCKVLVHLWGPDANAYVGRAMTLYRDPKVLWGGMAIGGIRISHLSDISATETMMLTETRKARKPFTVNPLVVAERIKPTVEDPAKPTPMQWFTKRIAGLISRQECASLLTDGTKPKRLFDAQSAEDQATIREMLVDRMAELEPEPVEQPDDGFPGDGEGG